MAESTHQMSAEEQQATARGLVAQFPLPEQVPKVEVHLGPDYQGVPSLWLEISVRAGLEIDRQEIRNLTSFTNDLQEYLLKNGISLFTYTTLEQVA